MLKLKIFTLEFNKKRKLFDDIEVLQFIDLVEVDSINSNFFSVNGSSYWSIAVHYKQSTAVREEKKTVNKTDKVKRIKEESENHYKKLTDEQKIKYNKLRNWRNERAKTEGIPPYIICNNRQLTELAQISKLSLSAMKKIKGIGDKKAEKYYADLCEIIK